ncbi:hypothetical protein BDB00DRAFT_835074 [Zychaea mexicana]|uniref:uncharacterized protein n=1 Tax=Zychaea mexicana TaxID=64656 RepID=UPI0022FEA142|nr:uncharacterized protein BDB00DRAFT_835074 [Zychaea mexicana]KAI9491073.1 hypothetical protein BDB00DRAFT_835074 [Zychaea mexicana]
MHRCIRFSRLASLLVLLFPDDLHCNAVAFQVHSPRQILPSTEGGRIQVALFSSHSSRFPVRHSTNDTANFSTLMHLPHRTCAGMHAAWMSVPMFYHRNTLPCALEYHLLGRR